MLLVSCPGNTRTKSSDLLQDRIGGSGPDERPTRTIVVLYEGVDFPHKVLNTGERTTANGALGDETEPAFHLVEPRGIGRGVVHVIAGPLRQPSAHLGMFVGGIVIDDQMKVEFGGYRLVQMAQEGEELLMAVAGLARGEHRARGDV